MLAGGINCIPSFFFKSTTCFLHWGLVLIQWKRVVPFRSTHKEWLIILVENNKLCLLNNFLSLTSLLSNENKHPILSFIHFDQITLVRKTYLFFNLENV